MSDETVDLDPAEPKPASSIARRVFGFLAILTIAVVAILTLLLSVSAWASLGAKVSVPDVTGQPVAVAVERIAASELTTAAMPTAATTDFGGGVVMDQIPAQGSDVPPGSPVDVLVAVPPTMTVVPDVSLGTTGIAENVLGYSLLRPIIYQQLSDTVDFGRVVGQIPRAGEPIVTGHPVAVFVSLGRGTGGAVVPNVVGLKLSDAANHIADVYLLTQLYEARPGMSMNDIVTDQLPAPGTRVPIGSAVPLMTGGSSK
jgi:serine/threonine-protein kinase